MFCIVVINKHLQLQTSLILKKIFKQILRKLTLRENKENKLQSILTFDNILDYFSNIAIEKLKQYNFTVIPV